MKTLKYSLALFLFANLVMTANAAEKLFHVVSFKFKSTASAEDIRKVELAFRGLKKQIPEIGSFEWGTNVSKEKHDKGFTHCFVLTFKSEKDRDAYIEHADHKAFGKLVGPVLDDVFVVDFWSGGSGKP